MTSAIDPFDELAAMFLTAPQAKAPLTGGNSSSAAAHCLAAMPARARNGQHTVMEANAQANEAIVELLIVGHLPVRAGLWLTPYADAVARQSGPTALLRLDSDEPNLKLLRAAGDWSSDAAHPMMRSTLIGLAALVDHWIVRVPASAAAAAADRALASVDRITILTSGDEAAIVAAYQLIKDLFKSADSAGGGQESTPRSMPAVRLAVVGADQKAAMAIVDRLNRTTVSFLGVEVRLGMCLQRIDAGVRANRHVVFEDQVCPSLAEVTAWLAEAKALAKNSPRRPAIVGKLHADRRELPTSRGEKILSEPAQSMPTIEFPRTVAPLDDPPMVDVPPKSAPRTEPHIQSPRHEPVKSNGRSPIGFRSTPPKVGPRPRPIVALNPADLSTIESRSMDIAGLPRIAPPPSSSAQGTASLPGPSSSVSPIKLAPKPAKSVEMKNPAKAVEPDDHGQTLPLSRFVEGLTALPVRSPGHERVELAVDQHGRLHLLGREQTLREMRLVESWARDHRELIALACPQHPIDQSAKVVCHIFSAEPVTLADLHGADLRLHVLAPVQVNGHTAWYAAQLNA